MKHGSLFNGIGLWQLAAHWMNWENIFSCEIENYGNQVSKRHFPNCIQHGDIKTTDFTIYRGGIDILTGSDPCQPHSYAGKQRGVADERFLWPSMLRAVKEIQSRWVVNENVEGTISNGVLDTKISDLEAEGYTCWPPLIMPANAFGALHRRNRVWLVAYSERLQQPRQEPRDREAGRDRREFEPVAWHTDWESALCEFRRMDDGNTYGVERIDSIRNGIVPQIAFQIFKAIAETDEIF